MYFDEKMLRKQIALDYVDEKESQGSWERSKRCLVCLRGCLGEGEIC